MNRVGGKINPFLSNSGLDTNIKGSNSNQYQKWLQKSTFMSMTSKDKSMMNGLQALKELCERLNIPDAIYKKSCELLKKVDDSGVVKGARLNTKCATILFFACV